MLSYSVRTVQLLYVKDIYLPVALVLWHLSCTCQGVIWVLLETETVCKLREII